MFLLQGLSDHLREKRIACEYYPDLFQICCTFEDKVKVVIISSYRYHSKRGYDENSGEVDVEYESVLKAVKNIVKAERAAEADFFQRKAESDAEAAEWVPDCLKYKRLVPLDASETAEIMRLYEQYAEGLMGNGCNLFQLKKNYCVEWTSEDGAHIDLLSSQVIFDEETEGGIFRKESPSLKEDLKLLEDCIESMQKANISVPVKERIKKLKPGDQYELGHYPSDDSQLIAWDVLDVNDQYVTLISHNILDTIPFNSNLQETDWNSSFLKRWLNCWFYDNGFSEEEQKLLYQPIDSDEISILSRTEFIKFYKKQGRSGMAEGTKFAKFKTSGLDVKENGNSYWWIREDDVNFRSNSARVVHDLGAIDSNRYFMIQEGIGVRPVIKLSVS